MTARQRLPIDDVLPQLALTLANGKNAVLKAPTGAGKTTRVPPFLADLPWTRGRSIVMLEPRRVAARAAAARIAEERSVSLGGDVGYAVRFEQRLSNQTRILVVTEGVFLRRLQSDPFLDGVAAVVFDEFHERSVNADLSLALVRQVQRETRPDLRIIVMSATLDSAPLTAFLGDCPSVESEGRLFPVSIEYAGPPGPPDLKGLPGAVRSAVSDLFHRTDGDLLVFLPGVGEIRRCEDVLESFAANANAFVAPLYGDLPLEAQSAALRKGAQRKIVLATNVAETSVTVEGVTGVIDSGLARVMRFEPGVGLDRLILTRISRASAEQRKGRAGRTAPGVCLRLWTQRDEAAVPERELPEIRRIDLAGPLLELHQWGESDPRRFPWFEPPPDSALERAERLLEDLGAIQPSGGITPLGRSLAQLPAHPRLARLLVAGAEFGVLDEASIAAALLSERDPFVDSRRRSARTTAPSDVGEKVLALQAFRDGHERFSDLGELHASSARSILRVADQLARVAADALSTSRRTIGVDLGLERAIFAAYPDRLARRRKPGDRRALIVGGRGVVLSETSVVTDDELFVAVELAPSAGVEDLVTTASAVRREWIPESALDTIDVASFDTEVQRVVARRQTRYRDLPLNDAAISSPDPTVVETALAEAAAKNLVAALGLNRDEIVRFRARLSWLREAMTELGLPAIDDDAIRLLLPTLCAGRKSFAELQAAPIVHLLEQCLSSTQRAALHREAPERLEVPTGSKITLQYEPGKAPVLAVRLQEMFGMTETPRIAGGRVPVLLHLLAPNYRPQQVTQDLRSFWENIYPKIRKELRMKYPKHAWPEDPFSAAPVRKGPSQKR